MKHEWALTLEDVMIRRSSWHYYHRNADKLAQQVADWMAEMALNNENIST